MSFLPSSTASFFQWLPFPRAGPDLEVILASAQPMQTALLVMTGHQQPQPKTFIREHAQGPPEVVLLVLY